MHNTYGDSETAWAAAIEGLYERYHRLTKLDQLLNGATSVDRTAETSVRELQHRMAQLLAQLLNEMPEGSDTATAGNGSDWIQQMNEHTQLIQQTNREVDERLRELCRQYGWPGGGF